MVFNSFI